MLVTMLPLLKDVYVIIEQRKIPLRRCGGTEHAEEAEASSFLSSPLISGTLLVGKHGVAVRTLGSSSWSN